MKLSKNGRLDDIIWFGDLYLSVCLSVYVSNKYLVLIPSLSYFDKANDWISGFKFNLIYFSLKIDWLSAFSYLSVYFSVPSFVCRLSKSAFMIFVFLLLVVLVQLLSCWYQELQIVQDIWVLNIPLQSTKTFLNF